MLGTIKKSILIKLFFFSFLSLTYMWEDAHSVDAAVGEEVQHSDVSFLSLT